MKKLILLASIALAAVVYQPAKAQVSINLSIGSRPYYTPDYYSYNTYYVPSRTVVYHPRPVIYHQKRYVSHRRVVYAPTRYHNTSYARPKSRYHVVKNYNGHGPGHSRGKSPGNHGRH